MECRAPAQLDLDCRAEVGVYAYMEQDTADLIQQLCTPAGMIMEDVAPIAVLTPPGERVGERLRELTDAADAITALLTAARVLHGRPAKV